MKAIAFAIVLLVSSSVNANELEFEGAEGVGIGPVVFFQDVALQDEDVFEASVEVASRPSDHIQ